MFQLTPRPSHQGVGSKVQNGRHCCLFACLGRDFQVRCEWTEEWSNRRGNRPRKMVIKACESKQIGGVAFPIPRSLPYLIWVSATLGPVVRISSLSSVPAGGGRGAVVNESRAPG
jgi:hypothetical protein